MGLARNTRLPVGLQRARLESFEQAAKVAGIQTMFEVVTIARESGSGGRAIAKRLAERLGWTLMDESLIPAVASEAHVNVGTVRRRDECVDPWWRRLHYAGLWSSALYAGVSPEYAQITDADSIAACTQHVIRSAASKGRCVIVGRAAECVLRHQPQVLRVFVYAPWNLRVVRFQKRTDNASDATERLCSIDRMRAAYVRRHFGCDWKDPALYQMMVDSQLGIEAAAELIARAAAGADLQANASGLRSQADRSVITVRIPVLSP